MLSLLGDGYLLMHEFVIGEISLGSMSQRNVILATLRDLPAAVLASNVEVAQLIEAERLFGLGIGYIDAHLLASALLEERAALWTRDRRLVAVARRLGVAALFD